MWIEIEGDPEMFRCRRSRPARALWIEILMTAARWIIIAVEAREGLVD